MHATFHSICYYWISVQLAHSVVGQAASTNRIGTSGSMQECMGVGASQPASTRYVTLQTRSLRQLLIYNNKTAPIISVSQLQCIFGKVGDILDKKGVNMGTRLKPAKLGA